ncbi:amidohydrolase [Muricauda oceani]|uniref:Amidohydrolase n=1 Tax=Flagellimonas oceani TaxID=2698672 RepID=A0A6G7IZG9_9FLAO|nr:amidohydrolase [Allomuricauda oceani]MBW8243692.1 amidohydrolase [Allomuricauda oceani]QII43946.1 amidohydrolase [Allomuricauda oceani]
MRYFTIFLCTVLCIACKRDKGEGAEIADLIVVNAKVAIMDEGRTFKEAIAIKDGKIIASGTTEEIMDLQNKKTIAIDAKGRTLIPGLNDSHLHLTRGGRFYNAELRWDGVKSLKRALEMLREQAERTPEGQWVRVIGGWSPFQFEEKRFPTPEEINKATGNVPTLILFLYSRAWLNQAGLDALGIDENTKAPEGSSFVKGPDGKLTGVLLAEPNPTILYARIASLPALSEDEMVNSTKQFYRELNSFGITSGIDAGGGGHKFPIDYRVTKRLAEAGEMPIRLSYYLFPQDKGKEYAEFKAWMANNKVGHNGEIHLDHGYELEGGGEFLAWSAGDFENFLAPQPLLENRPTWREDLKSVIRLHVDQGWPFRIHATYGETIAHMLDVLEEVNQETEGKLASKRWLFDHAETVQEKELQRIKDLNGGIAIQARLAYAGEFFVERYGGEKAKQAPPVRKMMDMGLPVGAGTDGTRVASYNPWPALYWLITGKTVGDYSLAEPANRLTREEALHLYTKGSAWISNEETVKGTLENGMYADFTLLSDDFFTIPEKEINTLKSVLTVVAGKVVYADGMYGALDPTVPEVIPDWSPVKYYGGYQSK